MAPTFRPPGPIGSGGIGRGVAFDQAFSTTAGIDTTGVPRGPQGRSDPPVAGREPVSPELRELALDLVQLSLDLAGIVDPTPISDGSGALLALARGLWLDSAISGVSMVPYVGDLAIPAATAIDPARDFGGVGKRASPQQTSTGCRERESLQVSANDGRGFAGQPTRAAAVDPNQQHRIDGTHGVHGRGHSQAPADGRQLMPFTLGTAQPANDLVRLAPGRITARLDPGPTPTLGELSRNQAQVAEVASQDPGTPPSGRRVR